MRRSFTLLYVLFISGVFSAQTYNYYFGNIHSHTGFSDGNKDSSSSGVSTPVGSYDYAKQSQDFDFLGISEHNHYSSKGNPGFKRPLYQQGLDMADAANENGIFVTLFGMEYGVSSEYNGHVLVYGVSQLLGWEETVPGLSGKNYDVFNGKSDYKGLFSKVNAVPGAFCYLAHPSFDHYTTDGTWNTALANAPYNASFDSAIVGMPLRSGLATNPGATYSDYPQGNYFNYYKKLLYQGYHLGIGYDHDNHYTNFGRGNGGRLVILATGLSRTAFFDAMRSMRFYGSDDRNARVTFECAGAVMGSVLSGTAFPEINLEHDDPDGELADTMRIWRGVKESGGLWAEIVKSATGINTLAFTDEHMMSDHEYYYFGEIRQKDGQWIVTSPVWYTRNSKTLLNELSPPAFSVYYDRSKNEMHVSVDVTAGFLLQLNDAHGRCVFSASVEKSETVLVMPELDPGVYFVSVTSNAGRLRKKILIR